MPTIRRHSVVLAALVLDAFLSPVVTAQNQLSVTDSTVVLPDNSDFVLANETGAAIVLDSLVMRFAGNERQFESWLIETEGGATPAFGCSFYRGLPGLPRCEPAAVFSSGDIVRVEVTYEICSICRAGTASHSARSGGTADTILVYSGGSATPARVVFDAAGYVGLGDAPNASGIAVTVGPNPSDGEVRLSLVLGLAVASVEASVYDALGRRVVTRHDGSLGAGEHALLLNSSRLSPGLYVVRVSAVLDTGVRWTETRRVTVTR